MCAGVSCIAKSQAAEAAGSSLDAMSSPTKTKLTFLSVWMTRGHFSKYSWFFFPIGGHNLHQCHPFLSGKGHHCRKILKISFNYQIFRMHSFLKHFYTLIFKFEKNFFEKKSLECIEKKNLRIYCNANFCLNLSTFEHHNLSLPISIPNNQFTICKSQKIL